MGLGGKGERREDQVIARRLKVSRRCARDRQADIVASAVQSEFDLIVPGLCIRRHD